MKKQLLFVGAAVILSSVTSIAQTVVPNGNLEAWTVVNGNDEPTGSILKSLNMITQWPGGAPATCFKETTIVHGGSASAKIVSKEITSLDLFVPGVLGTATPILNPPSAVLAVPFTSQPSAVKAWINYQPVQGDSAEIFAHLLKTTGGVRETLATASKIILQNTGGWALQDVPFVYSNTSVAPDSISFIFVSSAGYNFNNLFLCAGKINSTLYVDDVELVYDPLGVSEMLFSGEEINVYPNPSESILNISITQTLNNAVLSVTDMNGREVSNQNVSGNQFTLDVNTLKAGNYIMALKQNNTILGRKTFVKK